MADLSPNARKALWAWPFIEAGGRQRQTTAGLWDAVKAGAPDEGLYRSLSFGAGLSTLRGYWNRILNAQDALEASRASDALHSRHMAEAPWSRTLAEQQALPQYQVRVPITGETRAGAVVEKLITVHYHGALFDTVGETVEDATAKALARAIASDFRPIDTDTPQILVV